MKVLKINNYNNDLITDFEVIKKVLSGEKGLYEILMRRHNQTLYRVIRSYIQDEHLIKDVMQNTYILAYEKLHQFKEKSLFSTWLIRIGINEALKEIRLLNKNLNIKVQKSTFLSIKDNSPEKKMMENEARHILENAIDHLPHKYKTIYILREVEAMNLQDICDSLNLTKSNAKVRIHRAKAMLKDILYDQSYKTNVFEFGFSKCDALVKSVLERI